MLPLRHLHQKVKVKGARGHTELFGDKRDASFCHPAHQNCGVHRESCLIPHQLLSPSASLSVDTDGQPNSKVSGRQELLPPYQTKPRPSLCSTSGVQSFQWEWQVKMYTAEMWWPQIGCETIRGQMDSRVEHGLSISH